MDLSYLFRILFLRLFDFLVCLVRFFKLLRLCFACLRLRFLVCDWLFFLSLFLSLFLPPFKLKLGIIARRTFAGILHFPHFDLK